MSSIAGPSVSVIVVSRDGEPLLRDLLPALERQARRPDEVILVDNASQDGSVAMVRREFPRVRVLESRENLGFARANNLGMEAASGEYLALVNNDTIPEPGWLKALVDTAESDPGIGAVGSKILFLRPFVPLRLVVHETGPPRLAAERPILVLAEESGFPSCAYKKRIPKAGFGPLETSNLGLVRRWGPDATILLPIPDKGTVETLLLRLGATQELEAPMEVGVWVGSTPLGVVRVEGGLADHFLTVSGAAVGSGAFDVINNAGTRLSSRGEAADRGIYEPDRGQFDAPEEVEAFCGAAVLLRRSALDEIGSFDRDFFMYYEDTDLSWRLRSAGYRLRYEPRSVIRHVHAASSVEWSPLFNFYTARNRVLMVSKNGGPGAVLAAFLREWRTLGALLWRFVSSPTRETWRLLAPRLRVQASLVLQAPRALLKRVGILPH